MDSFSGVSFRRPVWRTGWLAFCLTFCGIVLTGLAPTALAEGDQKQVLPPPVPFYSAHVSKTTIIGDGMIVIRTEDPLDTVLDWYRANLKDQMASVAVGPGHHHFLTHNGAGVDLSVEGTGAGAETKIALLWNAGGNGPYQSQPPSSEAETAPTAESDKTAALELEAQQAQNDVANMASPTADTPVMTPQKVERSRIEPLRPHAIETQLAKMELPKLKQAEVNPPQVKPSESDETKKTEASSPSDTATAGPPGLTFFRAGRYAEALLTWQDASATGSVRAPLLIGMMYDTGQGVPRSYTDALNWYRTAAAKGSPTASFNIGVMYEAGFGVPKDRAEASEWYSHAAAKGFGRAAFNLALLFEKGDGVPQDDGSAHRYFKQAEGLGIAAARSHLGEAAPVPASTNDTDPALSTVHIIVNDAPKSGSANAAAAAERIRKLADKGDPAAQYDLAYCYEYGIGVEVDLHKALALYRKAASGPGDSRLKPVAEAAADQVKAHLNISTQASR
jgi:TPR repeat protein